MQFSTYLLREKASDGCRQLQLSGARLVLFVGYGVMFLATRLQVSSTVFLISESSAYVSLEMTPVRCRQIAINGC